jgi:hypothetical protein
MDESERSPQSLPHSFALAIAEISSKIRLQSRAGKTPIASFHHGAGESRVFEAELRQVIVSTNRMVSSLSFGSSAIPGSNFRPPLLSTKRSPSCTKRRRGNAKARGALAAGFSFSPKGREVPVPGAVPYLDQIRRSGRRRRTSPSVSQLSPMAWLTTGSSVPSKTTISPAIPVLRNVLPTSGEPWQRQEIGVRGRTSVREFPFVLLLDSEDDIAVLFGFQQPRAMRDQLNR